MKELIERLNSILSDWKAQFDVTDSVELEFCLNKDNKLCLNEHFIHVPKELLLSSAEFSAENIKFYFEGTNQILTIGILWPEDAVPELDFIRFGYESVL